MILILVLILCSSHAIKPHSAAKMFQTSFRCDFFRRTFSQQRDCCGCRTNHAILSLLCKLLQVPVPSQDWCHHHHRMWGGTMSRRRGALTDPWLYFLLSSRSQTRPSFSSLVYLRVSNCLLIINLKHLQPLRQTIHWCAFRFHNTIRWTLMTKKLLMVVFVFLPVSHILIFITRLIFV